MKRLLVTKAGGICRHPDGQPVTADDDATLKQLAATWEFDDWRIVSADLPWVVVNGVWMMIEDDGEDEVLDAKMIDG